MGCASGGREGQAIGFFAVDNKLDSIGDDTEQGCCGALEVDNELAAWAVDGEPFRPPPPQNAKSAFQFLGLQRFLETLTSLVEVLQFSQRAMYDFIVTGQLR